ncbi:uncharacterized protein LOC127712894 [Mytilus californianus]|uniref:uncharacterized protein LOC127712894 n=1 Tax=Mytilus californianus TaxID=6549 RepID=UPI002245C832|nr:uncharacterized protein LOC127712894 [Mytilus californianus]
MAPLSEEEENYIRLALLLKGVSPRAVRTYFDREFPPTHLPSTLNKNYNTLYGLKLNRVLNQAQWKLLFPRNGVPDSTTFDVTLMICLIRHLTSVNQPINGFGSLPLPVETTAGPDLARIKWYRNNLAHHDILITEKLEAWKEADKMYIEIIGAKSVFKCIHENGCVVVTGSSGTGKSSLVRHVALKMQHEGYDILPVSNPECIVTWHNPSKNLLFVVDDFCGTYAVNPMQFENWKNLMEQIKAIIEIKPVKLVMACRLQKSNLLLNFT